MAGKLKIEGGVPVKGEITVSGNKNAVLPMIAAALLTDETVTLKNVPGILDVKTMLEIAEGFGVSISRNGAEVHIRAADIKNNQVSKEQSSRARTSLLFTAPLLYRTGKACVWPPGGDVIGRRRLDAHFYGLSTLGAEMELDERPFEFSLKKFHGGDIFLDEASVTATEHLLMAASVAEGQTVIRNAASEPHVQNLAEMLIKMGAKINGVGTNTLFIEGVEKLSGTEHHIHGDHIEAGSFLCLAAATGGELTVKGICPSDYRMTRRMLERLGMKIKISDNSIFIPGGQELEIKPDFENAVPVISDGPWPQYPSDMMSCTIVTATRSKGQVLFFEKMFESRIYFVDRLISMGANAIVCDPHRVVVVGPSRLRGIEMSSPDIRAGMAMLIAALRAEGTSIIHNTDVIARGYENIVEKISSIGGKIANA